MPRPAVALLLCVSCVLGCASSRGRDVLSAQLYIEGSYADVWRHFTDAAAYAAWYSAPCREFGAPPGEAVVWGDDERTFYRGSLLAIEEGAGLKHTFQFVGFGFDEPQTTVEVEIVERGETVRVTVRHDCTDAPRTREIISPVGWAKSLSRLKTLIETGRAMPWPEAGRATRRIAAQ